ncbi:MAG: glycosyltransferase [Planctomycetes bacterium]|nr:glycosyltransferase [Planctomycetota bacterium]
MSSSIMQAEDNIQADDAIALYEERVVRGWPGEALLAGNLAALREKDEALAEGIGSIELGDTVRMVAAKDGSVSFRIRREDGRDGWLGFSSVPMIMGEANLQRTKVGAANMAMYRIGSGVEAAGILEKMVGYQALLVVEPDLVCLNLVMRLRDLRDALGRGRLALLVGDDVESLLVDFYERQPGYAMVEQTTTWTWLSNRENQGFAQQVNQAMQIVSEKMVEMKARLLEEQKDQEMSLGEVTEALAAPGSCRAVNCTDGNTPVDYMTSRDGLWGLSELGTTTDWLVFDRPDYGSQYAQLERLNRVRPHLILLVDRLRGDLALNLPESAVCVSLLRGAGVSVLRPEQPIAERMGGNDFVCPARGEQVDELRQAGVADERLILVPLGANTDLFRPMELEEEGQERYGGEVVMVGHKHSIEAETYQIKLPTHQQLFEAMVSEIRQGADGYCHEAAGRFLSRAEKCGIEVREDDLREFFTGLMQNYLGDAVVGDTYIDGLREAGLEVNRWYWSGTPEDKTAEGGCPTLDKTAGDDCGTRKDAWVENPSYKVIGYGEELNKLYNGRKIFLHISGSGWVDDYLLNGMAAGAFFLVKGHPRDLEQDGIGKMFELGKELVTFETGEDLVRKVRYFLSHDKEREAIAQAGREKVLGSHSYAIRMQEVLNAVVKGLG